MAEGISEVEAVESAQEVLALMEKERWPYRQDTLECRAYLNLRRCMRLLGRGARDDVYDVDPRFP